jgi:hypothetical protein
MDTYYYFYYLSRMAKVSAKKYFGTIGRRKMSSAIVKLFPK